MNGNDMRDGYSRFRDAAIGLFFLLLSIGMIFSMVTGIFLIVRMQMGA